MLQIRQNLKHKLLTRMKMMKLLIEKMKLSPKHQIQLRSRNFQANKMKVKNRVNGGTCRSLLNDVKSLSFFIENDQEKRNRVFSVLQNLKEEIEYDLIVEHLVDENVNYDSVSSFNVDITKRNKGEDLDESMQTNEDSKYNEFKENLSQKTPRVNLTIVDLSDLSHNRMLNDNIIQTFQLMLKIQYPDANGLQDPVLGQALSFAVYQTTPFVQVLHDGSLHWLVLVLKTLKKGKFS